MRGYTAGLILLAAAVLILQPCVGQEPRKPSPDREPYKDARKHHRGYFGAGRDDPEPDLKSLHAVVLGYFGPSDPGHPDGGPAWLGTNLAIDEANASGGYKGLPFRLSPVWAENPWADGAAKLTRVAYLERAWAIIGSIDGASTHLAETIVAKAHLTQIDPGSTDETVNQANVPWMFSCLPGDRPIAAALGGTLLDRAGSSFLLLTATDHDSRALTSEFKSFLSARRVTVKQQLEFPAGTEQTSGLASQAVASGARAVVVLAGARDSARLIRDLRRRDPGLVLLAGPSACRRAFLAEAGTAAEGVIVPVTVETSPLTAAFIEKFQPLYGFEPDYAATAAYDAASLLIAAIRKSGLNRVRIRDAVEDLSPWRGASGTIDWDPLGRNARPVRLGVIRGGGIAPLGD
ncbi:MAG TPA: ABC transporter substrate-binding protein [Bryobacteraceae bacterium]|nr:ABC transporter substrate-binding protein [Bryobacteraceae bacterium]